MKLNASQAYSPMSVTASLSCRNDINTSTSLEPLFPKWATEYRRRIGEFERFQNRYGSVDGILLSTDVVTTGYNFLSRVMNNTKETPFIALEDNGGLRLEWEKEDKYLAVTIVGTNKFNYIFGSDSEPEIIKQTVSVTELKELLSELV